MKTTNQEFGIRGEEIAKNHLISLNYSILETNWRSNHLEVDIIAENEYCIVFCEVKARSSIRMGTPESFVTFQKQCNLIKAAHHYVVSKNISKEVRFDIISVLSKGMAYDIEHIPDAFTPKW
jgi:putative endonuclease